jgi:hypothetical protein
MKRRRDKNPDRDPRWGHAAKILCLFVREAVVFRRALGDKAARNIEPFLYVPLDSEVIKRARKYKMRLKCSAIYEVSERGFFEFQNELDQAKGHAHRIWFDDLRGKKGDA